MPVFFREMRDTKTDEFVGFLHQAGGNGKIVFEQAEHIRLAGIAPLHDFEQLHVPLV